jgi:hypothetical protein
MADTEKQMTRKDDEQTARFSFNDSDASYSVSSFVSAVVGRRIEVDYPAADTEVYTWSNLDYLTNHP